MKVKELIEQLSKFDPETEVLGQVTDHTDYTYTLPIQDMDLDSPYDSNGIHGVDGSDLDDVDSDDFWNENDDYVGPKVVVIEFGDI